MAIGLATLHSLGAAVHALGPVPYAERLQSVCGTVAGCMVGAALALKRHQVSLG
jgi:hypothetical protein